MRKKFEVQYELGVTPVEKIKLPLRSRDELPAVLRALQYICIIRSEILNGTSQNIDFYVD